MAKNNKTRFFYVLYSDKTRVFDQSECAYYPIYIIMQHIYLIEENSRKRSREKTSEVKEIPAKKEKVNETRINSVSFKLCEFVLRNKVFRDTSRRKILCLHLILDLRFQRVFLPRMFLTFSLVCLLHLY